MRKRPSPWPYLIALVLLVLFVCLMADPAEASGPDSVATWYGNEFMGKHHAAHWHRKTPLGAPAVVNDTYLGCAAPISFPFGAQLTFQRIRACKANTSLFDGAKVTCTVVDRKELWAVEGYFDLWPATARELGFGPSYEVDDGCITVRVWRVVQKERILGAKLRKVQARYEGK